MADSMISSVRMRALTRLGRYHPGRGRHAASTAVSASRPDSDAEASSRAVAFPPRPRAASARPGDVDLMESAI